MRQHSADTGVIAPPTEPVAASLDHLGPPTVLDALQSSPAQAILDLPLPQLPADLPPIEPPAFVLSRKINEDSNGHGAMPGGMPGMSGAPAPDANDILSGVHHQVSSALDGAGNAIHQSITPAIDAAQSAVGQAQSAISGALGAQAAAPSMAAAVPATAAVPNVPALPADPVAALMNGLALPALPGVDMLFKPILDLLSSMGTGVLGAINPTTILSSASKVIETAMQVGKGSMTTVDQLWQSQAARNAQAASQKANTEGQDTSKRGTEIADLTQQAAAVVQRGNMQLTGIAASFATQATALAPVLLTPPAQATLIAAATEHLGQAVGVVNATRFELSGHKAALDGVVGQLVGSGAGGPAPQEVAQAVAKNIAEPILNQAKDTTQSAADTATKAAGLQNNPATPGSPSSTVPSSVNTPHAPTSPGAPGGMPIGTGGRPGSPSRPGISGIPGSPSSSVPKTPGLPGTTIPGGRPMPGVPEPVSQLRAGTPGATPGGTGTGSGFMGSPAAAGAGGRGEEEHSRNVQPYQSRTGNDDLTGPLGESTPDVIGATHPDEVVGSDYEQDQF